MKKNFFLLLSKLALLVILACVLLPFGFTLSGSFMHMDEVNAAYAGVFSGYADGRMASLRFLPRLFTLAQYEDLFSESLELIYGFWNSFILLLPTLAGCLLVAPAAGYAFAKFRFCGSRLLLGLYILLAVLPYQTMLVPNYIMFDKLNLLGSRATIWLSGIFHPLGVFICYRWMDKLPQSILEAAEIDGCGSLAAYRHIIWPLSRPAIATTAVLTAADIWNMIEQPQLFLESPQQYPLSLLMANLGKDHLGTSFACGVLFAIPMALFFLWCKDDFLYGTQRMASGSSTLTQGGIKP